MNKTIFAKVFLWMFFGLLLTFGTGYFVSTNENMLYSIFTKGYYWFFLIAELVAVIFLSARIQKMKPMTAKITFLLYSFLTGLTFSTIFVVYALDSVLYVFLIAAIVFGIFAMIGFFTHMDLTKIGTYLMMGLLAVIVLLVFNLFIPSDSFQIFISIISILVFLGFTAYDVQKIKQLEFTMEEDNLAIYGALQLYLDFINIFLDLLRLFGKDN